MRVAVAKLEELPAAGALKRVTVDGLPPLVLGNADGVIFALQDECNHGQANLSDGDLTGFELMCPLHSGCFDVRTGKAIRRPAKRWQPRFVVEIFDGIAYASLEVTDAAPPQNANALATTTEGRDS